MPLQYVALCRDSIDATKCLLFHTYLQILRAIHIYSLQSTKTYKKQMRESMQIFSSPPTTFSVRSNVKTHKFNNIKKHIRFYRENNNGSKHVKISFSLYRNKSWHSMASRITTTKIDWDCLKQFFPASKWLLQSTMDTREEKNSLSKITWHQIYF